MSAASGGPGDRGPAMSLETPLKQVRGLGAAREGAEHWWHERMSSVAALLLYLWLGMSLARLPTLDHATIAEWLAAPSAAVPMLLLVGVTFWHARMGLQVVVEDYVHDEGAKLFWILAIRFAAVLGAALAAFAVLKIALGGGGA